MQKHDPSTHVERAIQPATARIGTTYSSVSIHDPDVEPTDDPEAAYAALYENAVEAAEDTDEGFISVEIYLDLHATAGRDVTPELHENDRGRAYTPSTLNIPEEQVADDPVVAAVERADVYGVVLSTWIKNPERVYGVDGVEELTPRAIILLPTKRAPGHPDNR